MKKIFFTFAMLLMSISMQAQTNDIKAQSIYDVNQDDKVAVSDVTAIVNRLKIADGSSTEKTVVDTEKLLEVLNALYAKINELSSLKSEIASLKYSMNQVKSNLGIEYVDPNLLPGKFSVSATKKVRFAKSNLYWDGSAYHFEDNQTDYPTTWDANHVGHFFWTNLVDYQSGTASYMPYAESYSYSSQSTSDKFWCGEDNKLTVDGTDGLYSLTGGDNDEWNYLIFNRTNANSLCYWGATVTNNGTSYSNGLIIAPDDFTEELKDSYTLDEVNAAGLVFLPAAGYRLNGSSFGNIETYGSCWSATPDSYDSRYARDLEYAVGFINTAMSRLRSYGRIIRLVRTVE